MCTIFHLNPFRRFFFLSVHSGDTEQHKGKDTPTHELSIYLSVFQFISPLSFPYLLNVFSFTYFWELGVWDQLCLLFSLNENKWKLSEQNGQWVHNWKFIDIFLNEKHISCLSIVQILFLFHTLESNLEINLNVVLRAINMIAFFPQVLHCSATKK